LHSLLAYPAIFALMLLMFVLATALGLVWLAERSPVAPLLSSCAGVVAAYACLPALLFGLFSAFLANDVVSHHDRAHAAVAREAESIRLIIGITNAAGEPGRILRKGLAEYGRKSISPDWRSEPQVAGVETLTLQMLQEVLFGGLARADAEVRHTAIDAIKEIRSARRDRISVADSTTAKLKWIAAFFLGFLTQIAVVVVHLGKPRAAILAGTIFAVAMAFTLWVILQRLDPFEGRTSVSLAPIAAALRD
jgi:hypothetical protein